VSKLATLHLWSRDQGFNCRSGCQQP